MSDIIVNQLREILVNVAKNIPDTEPLDYRLEFHKRAHVALSKQYPEGYRVALKRDGSVLCQIIFNGEEHNLKLHGVVNDNLLV